MRAIFSVLSLLVVVFIVMKLVTSQTQALKSVGGTSSPGGSAPAAARNEAQRAADMVQKAMEQGAAQRAAEAASQ